MTKKTKSALITQAGIIRDEVLADANTAIRVGTMNEDNADSALNELDEGYVQVTYGAGAGDQAVAIQAAIDAASSGDTLRFRGGIVEVETQVNVNKTLQIIGNAATEFKTTSDIAIFNVTATECSFKFFKVTGDASAGGLGGKSNQYAITGLVSGASECKVSDVKANNLNGGFMKLQNITGANRRGWDIIDCSFKNCNFGIWLNTTAEYCNIVNCSGTFGQRALSIVAGNTSILGGNYSENARGIQINGTANAGHGQIVGVTAKHNTTANLDIIEIGSLLGMVVSGCSFWSGAVKVKDAEGVNITGCAISGTVTIDNCSAIMSNNYMHTTPTPTLLNGGVAITNHNYTSGVALWV